MPPRLLCVVIVAFWLGMTAWLFQRDIWPRLAPGEPPPFTVNPADANKRADRFPTNWVAVRTAPSGDTEEYRIALFRRYDKDSKGEYYYEYRARWGLPKSSADSRWVRLARMITNY